jgi:hypothetical protein
LESVAEEKKEQPAGARVVSSAASVVGGEANVAVAAVNAAASIAIAEGSASSSDSDEEDVEAKGDDGPVETDAKDEEVTDAQVLVKAAGGISTVWKKEDTPLNADAKLDDTNGEERTATIKFTRGAPGVYLRGAGSIPTSFAQRKCKLVLSYFLLMFPLQIVDFIVNATNSTILAEKGQINPQKFFTFIGLLFVMTVLRLDSKREYWNKETGDELFPCPDFSRYMGLAEFERFQKHLKLDIAETTEEKDDKWFVIRRLIREFNARRRQVISPGEFVCIDESMVPWEGADSAHRKHGAPYVTKIIRKPTPVGIEIKNAACSQSGVMLALEVQEGKEAMARKDFANCGSAGTAWVLRLTKEANLFASWRTVCADSAFASVKTALTCLQHKMHFRGVVKTATKLFPLHFFNRTQLNRGDSVTLTNGALQEGRTVIAHSFKSSAIREGDDSELSDNDDECSCSYKLISSHVDRQTKRNGTAYRSDGALASSWHAASAAHARVGTVSGAARAARSLLLRVACPRNGNAPCSTWLIASQVSKIKNISYISERRVGKCQNVNEDHLLALCTTHNFPIAVQNTGIWDVSIAVVWAAGRFDRKCFAEGDASPSKTLSSSFQGAQGKAKSSFKMD